MQVRTGCQSLPTRPRKASSARWGGTRRMNLRIPARDAAPITASTAPGLIPPWKARGNRHGDAPGVRALHVPEGRSSRTPASGRPGFALQGQHACRLPPVAQPRARRAAWIRAAGPACLQGRICRSRRRGRTRSTTRANTLQKPAGCQRGRTATRPRTRAALYYPGAPACSSPLAPIVKPAREAAAINPKRSRQHAFLSTYMFQRQK